MVIYNFLFINCKKKHTKTRQISILIKTNTNYRKKIFKALKMQI